MLKSMGMSTQGGKSSKKVVVSSAAPMLVDAFEEEAGHVCVVCGEGESYRPGEPLGAYVYCKRVPLLASVERARDRR